MISTNRRDTTGTIVYKKKHFSITTNTDCGGGAVQGIRGRGGGGLDCCRVQSVLTLQRTVG